MSSYESLLRTHVAPVIGSVPIDGLSRRDLDGLIATMSAKGSSPKTIRLALSLVHSIYEHAIRQEWATGTNPAKLVDKPQVKAYDELRYLLPEEIEAVLRSYGDDDPLSRTDRVLTLAASMTGLRQGELLGLRWKDVDWTAARVRVRRTLARDGTFSEPKSRRGIRSVPLADRLAMELESHFQASGWQADDDLVFPHPDLGVPLDGSKLLKRFKVALKDAGVRCVRFHDLRHSFATRMAAAGVPMRTLQAWLGHRDFATTLRYADYMPSEQEGELVERAFASSTNSSTNLASSGHNSTQHKPALQAK